MFAYLLHRLAEREAPNTAAAIRDINDLYNQVTKIFILNNEISNLDKLYYRSLHEGKIVF